jgi:hypothetical protein
MQDFAASSFSSKDRGSTFQALSQQAVWGVKGALGLGFHELGFPPLFNL